MKSEKWIQKKFDDLEKFLEHMEELENMDIEVYETAVQKYELLHQILEVPSEPRWCS